jgi:hypothetical protein
MKKGKIVAAILVACAATTFFVCKNPLRSSEGKIQKRLMQTTPIGSTYTSVKEALQGKYKKVEIRENIGFLRQELSNHRVVGVKSIEVHLGEYFKFPFGTTSVSAFWGFDADGKLLEIWVWKTTDSL